jgi:hypothetical protein
MINQMPSGREFRVPRKKTKYYVILVMSVVGVLKILDFFNKNGSFSTHSGYFFLLLIYIVFHYLILLPVSIWKLFSSKPNLLMNSEGIYCRKQISFPRKLVRWELLESYFISKDFGDESIVFRLKDNNLFFKQFPFYLKAIKMGLKDAVLPLRIYVRLIDIDQKEFLRHLSIWLPYQEPDLELEKDIDLGDDVKR